MHQIIVARLIYQIEIGRIMNAIMIITVITTEDIKNFKPQPRPPRLHCLDGALSLRGQSSGDLLLIDDF